MYAPFSGWSVVPANQTRESAGKPDQRKGGSQTFGEGARNLGREPPLSCECLLNVLEKEFVNQVPESFPGSSRTPLSVAFSSKLLKQRGRERKGRAEIIQKFRLRNWPISSADFPMTPMEGTEHHFGPF